MSTARLGSSRQRGAHPATGCGPVGAGGRLAGPAGYQCGRVSLQSRRERGHVRVFGLNEPVARKVLHLVIRLGEDVQGSLDQLLLCILVSPDGPVMVTTGMDLLIRPGIGLGLCVSEYTITSRLGSTSLERILEWQNLLRLQQLSSASAETRNEYSRSRNNSHSSSSHPGSSSHIIWSPDQRRRSRRECATRGRRRPLGWRTGASSACLSFSVTLNSNRL